MIATTRSRRLCGALAGAILLMAVAGCTVGTTTIPAGNRGNSSCAQRDFGSRDLRPNICVSR
jgi:hypothetical protein